MAWGLCGLGLARPRSRPDPVNPQPPKLQTEAKETTVERGSEMDLVMDGYKSGGCGGVFVSWIEA